ncbi:MAG TPA: hypothetical protein PKA56_05850 [Solirubrobacterales bacterium]|nr:hypothetical protein [Solirubrobacterales bacterium]HNF84341.1 hypothetical protein [Solirubrobacterales bacterium]
MPTESQRIREEIRQRMRRLDELEGAGVPTNRAEAAELAKTDPDRFNDLWESGALGNAMKTTEPEEN